MSEEKKHYQQHLDDAYYQDAYKEKEFSSEELLRRVTECADALDQLPKSFPNEFQDEQKHPMYPLHWGGIDIEKPQEANKPKYEIIYDETSCYNWGFSVNGVWRSGEVEEGVKQPEEDDELLDYVLQKLKEDIKNGHTSFKSVMDCLQYEEYEYDKDSCEQCGHSGSKTIWRI